MSFFRILMQNVKLLWSLTSWRSTYICIHERPCQLTNTLTWKHTSHQTHKTNKQTKTNEHQHYTNHKPSKKWKTVNQTCTNKTEENQLNFGEGNRYQQRLLEIPQQQKKKQNTKTWDLTVNWLQLKPSYFEVAHIPFHWVSMSLYVQSGAGFPPLVSSLPPSIDWKELELIWQRKANSQVRVTLTNFSKHIVHRQP